MLNRIINEIRESTIIMGFVWFILCLASNEWDFDKYLVRDYLTDENTLAALLLMIGATLGYKLMKRWYGMISELVRKDMTQIKSELNKKTE